MAEKRHWLEIVIMPVVVALVGVLGTYLITAQQKNNAAIMQQTQHKSDSLMQHTQLLSVKEQAAADRQVKVLEIFSEKITSSDENERVMALRMLEVVDADLADKFASAVSEAEPEVSRIKQVADQVVQDARIRRPPDLSFVGWSFDPPNPIVGQPVDIRVTIKNIGSALAESFQVEWWPGAKLPNPAKTWTVDGLGDGEQTDLVYRFKGYRKMNPNMKTKMVIDPDGAVNDGDRSNNQWIRTINVNPEPAGE